MKKPSSFPFEHQAGGTVFRVYRAAQQKTQDDGTQEEYESYLVKYYEGAKLVQKRKSSWADVDTLIEAVVTARRNHDPERLELTGRDRRIYLAAVEALDPLGGEVDQAVREFVAAAQVLAPHDMGVLEAAQKMADELKRLGKIPVSTAIDFFLRHGKSMTAVKTVPEVMTELINELRKDGCGDYHVRDLTIRLRRFSEDFAGAIHEVPEVEISLWLQSLKKVVWDKKTVSKNSKQVENDRGELVSSRTRNNYRDAIFELFEFARRRGYVPKGLPTEAEETKRVKVVPGKNHIISPEEAEKILKKLPTHLIPFTVLKLFSGMRTEEAYALHWEHLRFHSRALIIEAELAKLRQRRVPPIFPNLAEWLRPFQGLKGPINPDYSSPHAVQEAVRKNARRADVVLKRNTFRNCYISYRVAQPTLPAVVAEEAGTSVRMVKANYMELATKEEAEAWFSIMPSKKQTADIERFVKEIQPKNQP
jgi:integrase